MSDDFAGLDATAQAELVRLGQVSPVELLDATIARIERLEPAVNAFTTTRFDRARKEAAGELPDGPFRGVPFALKDLTCTLKGEPASDGVKVLKETDWRAPGTSHLAARFQAAGLVIVGPDQHPGARHHADHRAARVRPDAQPVGPRPHARRVVGRLRRGGRRPAWSRSRTPPTVAGRSGSRPRAAASWASRRRAAARRSVR